MLKNQVVLGLIEEALNDYIEAKRAFTALDVVKTVQALLKDKLGESVDVPHGAVSDIIFETMSHAISTNDSTVSGYAYEQRVTDQQRNLTARVYFHSSAPSYVSHHQVIVSKTQAIDLNALALDRARRRMFAPVASGRVITPDSIAGMSAAKIKRALQTGTANKLLAPQRMRKVDNKLRLRFPAPALRQAGFDGGDIVDIHVDKKTKKIVVTAQNSTPADTGLYAGTRKLDCYGNIRLGLKQFGVTDNEIAFGFDADGDSRKLEATPTDDCSNQSE